MKAIRPHKLFKGQVAKMWLPEQLARREELSAAEKLVWARLARYEGENGEARPKLQTLSASLGISYDTAQRAVKALERHGLIRVTHRYRRPSLIEFLDHPWLRGKDRQSADPAVPQIADVVEPQIADLPVPQIADEDADVDPQVADAVDQQSADAVVPQIADGVTPQNADAEGSHLEGSHLEGSQRSPEEDLWIELEACRIARCVEVGLEPGASERRSAKGIKTILGRAVRHLGLVDRETAAGVITKWDQLGDLYETVFLAGDFGKDGDPPWPIELFCSNRVLDNAKRKADKLAAAPQKPTSEAA